MVREALFWPWLKRFLLIFLPSMVGVSVILVVLGLIERKANLRMLEAREAVQVSASLTVLESDVRRVVSDLLLLESLPAVRHYLNGGGAGTLDDLAQCFEGMMRVTGLYDQVRLLDVSGREVLRLNWVEGRAVRVPAAALQDKSSRYYFSDAIRLAPGQVYVSPLDLNIEGQAIEVPYKPTLRVAKPVFNSEGRAGGVLVLNYLANEMLEDFRLILRGEARAMLLNREGYWLNAPDPADAWGFMFDRGPSFAERYPDVWARIQANSSGSVLNKDGLFTFSAYLPLRSGQISSTGTSQASGASQAVVSQLDYRWTVVSFIPREQLEVQLLRGERFSPLWWALLGVTVLLGSALLAYLWLARQQAVLALRDSESRLRAVTDALAEGVVVLDRRGAIAFANPEACALLFRSLKQLTGHPWSDFVVDAEGRPLECRMDKVLTQGQRILMREVHLARDDGDRLPISMSVSPLPGVGGGIAGAVIAFHDISERLEMIERLRLANAELDDLAGSDGLTGLANRRRFDNYLAQELLASRRAHSPLSVIMIDIDHFKDYNDRHGHPGGDEVLRKVARVMATIVNRPRDMLARYGGEEFVAALPETGAAGAMRVAENLRRAVEGLQIAHGASSVSPWVTISLGVACFDGQELGERPSVLLAAADNALYRSKRGGRNRVSGCQSVPTALAFSSDAADEVSGE